MSFPSCIPIAQSKGYVVGEMKHEQAEEVLLEAYQIDTPLGFNALANLVERMKNSGEKLLEKFDPNSELGKQVARLVGTHVQHKILEDYFGVQFFFYNCCNVECVPLGVESHACPGRQIMMQETIDC
jgi:hypothetical protein